MGVVTEQPATSETKQDIQPTGPPPPAYDGAYGQTVGPQQGAVQQIAWMPIPTLNIPLSCPPGLEYLTQVDHMLVEQQIELLEVVDSDIECANKYRISNSLNQQVYFATEESDMCQRMCLKNERAFTMHILDNVGREVMRVNRPFQCLGGCCWCADQAVCSLYLEVEAPVGQVIGRVKQTKSFLAAHFDITSPNDEVLLKIRGPTCVCDGPCCTDDQDFFIFTPDLGTEIGKISKKWGGFVREMFTKADKFGVSFPLDLDVKMKATLLGALFLIDFMFFEDEN